MDIIVIKLGTSSITDDTGSLNPDKMQKVVNDVATLHEAGHKVILVSSGAVGNGKGYLANYKGTTKDRKAAAAIGNPILINTYASIFGKKGIIIAQTLLERAHFSNRKQFLQLRSTIETLWENRIIPIANENDVVSDLEIRFSDNDHLATLIAAGLGADQLLIASSVEGVLDHDNKVIPTIEQSNDLIQSFVRDEKSSMGLGGMATKLSYAKLAASLGITTKIFGLATSTPITSAFKGEIGSQFIPKTSSASARLKWLASGSLAMGSIEIDKGAKDALEERKSLLLVGVTGIKNTFGQGEIIEIKFKNKTIAVGISKLDSNTIDLTQKENNKIVVHANNMVLL